MKQLILHFGVFTAILLFGGVFADDAKALNIEAGPYLESISPETEHSWIFIETRLLPRSLSPYEIENIFACDEPVLCSWNMSRKSRETTLVGFSKRINDGAIAAFVSSVAPKVNRDPRNAVFGETPERTITAVSESEDGISLDEPGSVSVIREAIDSGRTIAKLPVTRKQPDISSSDLESIGIRELVSEGQTDFSGSPKNRIHNIKRALEQFQSVIIRPGEEFSFVKYLGEVDGEHGYLPELVIKYNKTEPEFGGGICQVSSTVFRAAVNAGFKVTARKNHAYPVRYYKPYGMDATIYIPNPDLRFVNNTPGAILVLSAIEGTKLSFRFYGTKDGRTVTIDGPHILESNPDGSMKTTFSQKVVSSDGKTIINDSFPSNYKSPDLYPHFEILSEKPKDWTKKQWSEYLIQKADYEAKLRAAYATVVRNGDN